MRRLPPLVAGGRSLEGGWKIPDCWRGARENVSIFFSPCSVSIPGRSRFLNSKYIVKILIQFQTFVFFMRQNNYCSQMSLCLPVDILSILYCHIVYMLKRFVDQVWSKWTSELVKRKKLCYCTKNNGFDLLHPIAGTFPEAHFSPQFQCRCFVPHIPNSRFIRRYPSGGLSWFVQ